eukprot:TRINITY_DN19826_c0_g1_i1.p1 TRINITY_DN19826_c0_g1~~TRINITY_DN19826_c0_g1_i1.p1  ORF type:complete len:354 (-),score=42.45 TRINITY_DN19826_c0_g1_i1:142-1203(-)
MATAWGFSVLCVLVLQCPLETQSCSHFAMENDYKLTVRTMDLGNIPFSSWQIMTVPIGTRGLRSSSHGYVGFVIKVAGFTLHDLVFAGMNDAGLTCDLQTLLGTRYPQASQTDDNIDVAFLCRWALEGFASIAEVKQGLEKVRFVEPSIEYRVIGGAHWALRDAHGQGLIVEFLDGEMKVMEDNNDNGKTGFGIMTNEPPISWQTQAIRHLQWKQSLARSAVSMPGSWYPDERFQRIHLVKSGMPKPATHIEAMMQATHVLNTVTVPMGEQLGTDSGKRSGEGSGDHTQWGVIYDHANTTVYWRSTVNQNLQRLRLVDAHLEPSKPQQYLAVFAEELPWFNDVAGTLTPVPSV